MRHYRALLVTTVLLVISPVLAFAATINVPSGQTTIQAAINAAVTGDVVVVAAGTYAENLDFKGKAITVRSTNPLSPAVVGATILDGANKGSVVTFQTGETTASLLSGFTITRGSGALDVHGILSGGGVYCYYASPSLTYNVIRDNQAGQGGGLYCAYSFPTVSLCTFRGNQSTAPFRGGGAMGLWHSSPTLSGLTINSNTADHFGGGVLCETNSSPLFTGSTLSNNTAGAGGGGLCCNDHSSPIVSGLTFTGNKANTTTYGPGDGGGVFCTGYSSPTLARSIFRGNTAANGGGLCCAYSSPDLPNNTLSGNSATNGGGIYCRSESVPIMKSTIIALSSAGGGVFVDVSVDPGAPAAPYLGYSDVYGNSGGNYVNYSDLTGSNNNLSSNPLFVNAATGNFRLKSRAGHWSGSAWVLDTVSSPCIDTGALTATWTSEPLPNGGRINMGYDGNTAQTSKTPPPTVIAWSPRGTAAARGANLTATFDTEMVHPSAQGALKITVGGVALAGGGTFKWKGNQMTFNPSTDLAAGTSYKVVIGTGARSAVGLHLEKAFTWTFTTGAAAPALLAASAAPTAAGAQITLSLASAADVTVTVRNLAGREVAVLKPDALTAGVHSLLWNGKSRIGTRVPPGTYLVQVCAHAADGTTVQALTSLPLR